MINNDFTKIIRMDVLMDSHFQYGMSMEGSLFIMERDIAICKLDTDNMTLLFPHYSSGIVEYAKQTICLDWNSPYYGNKRAYFICPDCGKRVLSLYSSENYYSCRKCDNAYNKKNKPKHEEVLLFTGLTPFRRQHASD